MGMEMIQSSIKFHCDTKLNLRDEKDKHTTEIILANGIFTAGSIKTVGDIISPAVHNGTSSENQRGFLPPVQARNWRSVVKVI